MKNNDTIDQLALCDSPTKEEVTLIQKGLENYNKEQTNGEIDNPGIEINLVVKDTKGDVVGGLAVSTMIRVMHLESFWVAKEHRKRGYGRELVLEAERIGREKGCITSQTMTFSFQAPEFYQKIGYTLIGIYNGYRHGITESILIKRLQYLDNDSTNSDRDSGRFSIVENAPEKEMEIVHAGLHEHFYENVEREPKVDIQLVVRDHTGKAVGDLLGGSVIGIMYIEHLWLDEQYRGLGYGKKLVMEAERIAKENGLVAVQTWSPSFQAPEFFQKLGYKVYATADSYPDPIKEYHFIKKFSNGSSALQT